jgi:hypothetical protein
MWISRVALVPVIVACSCACGRTLAVIQLQPEDRSTLRVGDVAAVRVAAERHYSIGSAGTSLVLTKRTEERGTTVYFYRAVAAGPQTLVLTPRDPGPDGCISCVTVHYFVTVAK